MAFFEKYFEYVSIRNYKKKKQEKKLWEQQFWPPMCEEDEPAVIWATTANGEAHVLYGMSKPGVVYSNRQKSKFLFFGWWPSCCCYDKNDQVNLDPRRK